MSSSVDSIVIEPQPQPGPPTKICPRCGGPVEMRTKHVAIEGNAVRAYCSRACASAMAAGLGDPLPARPRRRWLYRLGRLSLGLPMLFFVSGPGHSPGPHRVLVVGTPGTPAEPEAPIFGPAWPPSESDWMQEIAGDAWIHPLDGPVRRMPVRDGRVFGAERPGDRPGECRAGHCGVDLGGETWGEPVHAAHEGVVDRVQRGPNEEHGGLYVRLAHRDGTIFTQYFHLAAIPRAVQTGAKVKVGDVIGLLGDSGVKHSAPHLHFTVSVKPSRDLFEQYIDPEPLIALWPLRIAVGAAAAVTAQAAPGLVHGANKRRPKRRSVATEQALPAPPPPDPPVELD